jgi:hypothetical protein
MAIRKWAGFALTVAIAAFAGIALADSDWQKLGERAVDHREDHDQIMVTRTEGDFKRVQLRVKGSPVEIDNVKVTFGNGYTQDLDVRDRIKAGGSTRAIDLQGDVKERVIRRVDFDYRTDAAGQKAVVELWGMS